MSELTKLMSGLGEAKPRLKSRLAQGDGSWCDVCLNINPAIMSEVFEMSVGPEHRSYAVKRRIRRLKRHYEMVVSPEPSRCGFCSFLSGMMEEFGVRMLYFEVDLSWQNLNLRIPDGRADGRVEIYRPAELTPEKSKSIYSHIPIRSEINPPYTDDSFNKLKVWLETCTKTHVLCQQNPMPPPKRLLYIGSVADGLVHLYEPPDSSREPYVALSYCWGKASFLKTLKSNIESLQQGFDPKTLPQSVKDAVHISQKLGLKYIWVDALCIIQDDKTDWEEQSAKMCSIYEQAYLTIAASSVSSAHMSFLNRLYAQLSASKYQAVDQNGDVLAARTQCRNGHHYKARSGPPPAKDPLDTRGWTLQESILPTRIIFYSSEELQWRCKSIRTCECEVPPSDEEPPPLIHGGLSHWEILGAWVRIVEKYTERRLSHPEDRLPALSGVAHLIHKLTGWQYLGGLWTFDLIYQLLWQRQSHQYTLPSLPYAYRAPSFSWASVGYPVYMLANRQNKPTHSFQDDAWFVDAEMELGTDKFGRVESGWLTMRGKLIHACEVRESKEVNVSQSLRANNSPIYEIYLDDKWLRFYADVVLETFNFTSSDGTTRSSVKRARRGAVEKRPEFESGSTVSLFFLGHELISEQIPPLQYFLVLGVSPSDHGAYERIGFYYTHKELGYVKSIPEQITIF
ncbi:HET-domain-containing protein [Hypoxylon sp. FL1857]|nr:HET-domain-containing protein [Hypoxylon sp. FL1857]